MDQSIQNKLESLGKDEASTKELKEIYAELLEERDKYKKHLNLLEQAIENDYDSILITELNLEEPGPKIVYVNDGFSKISGYSREEIIGETPRILQGPKTDRDTLDRLKRRLKNGRAFFGQAINYRKDGTEFVNQWDIHPLTDDEGNITHWVSYQHDISERKRAEAKVMDTHLEFDELREQSKSTLIDVSTEGTIESTNKAFRNLAGYDKDELEGRKIWELFPKKYRNSLKARFEKQFNPADFQGKKLEGIIKHKQGLPIQVQCNTSVLNLKDQTIIRMQVNNISLQKRIMETLEKRNKNYEKIVDQSTEFTYKIKMKDGTPVVDYVSEDFAKVTGLPAEEVTNSEKLQRYIHQDDVEKFTKHLKSVFKGEPSTCEYRIRTKDGSYAKILDYSRPGTCSKQDDTPCVRGAVRFREKEMTA